MLSPLSKLLSVSSETWKTRFEILGLILLCATAIDGCFAWYFAGKVNDEQKKQLAEFDSRLTDAKTALATQQERAAKAERDLLEERQHSANRDISVEDQKVLSEKLHSFSGQHVSIDVFPVNFESVWIGDQIASVLVNAKWEFTSTWVNKLSTPPDTMVQGIWVRSTADDKSVSAAKELFRILRTAIADGSYDPSPLPGPDNPRVWVLVGDKPTPLRSWVK